MKNIYIKPKSEEIEIRFETMLCISGGFGGDAAEPALSPDWTDESFYDNGYLDLE